MFSSVYGLRSLFFGLGLLLVSFCPLLKINAQTPPAPTPSLPYYENDAINSPTAYVYRDGSWIVRLTASDMTSSNRRVHWSIVPYSSKLNEWTTTISSSNLTTGAPWALSFAPTLNWKYTWAGAAGTNPPPTHSLLVNSNIEGSRSSSAPIFGANNGFADPPVFPGSIHFKGSHIVTRAPSDGIANYSLPMSVNSSGVGSGGAFALFLVSAKTEIREPNLFVSPFKSSDVLMNWMVKDEPEYKEINAYAKIGHHNDGVAGNPLIQFFEGASTFSFDGKRNGASITLRDHSWSVSPDVFLPQTSVPSYTAPPGAGDTYSLDEHKPETPTRTKNFHWNLGPVENADPATFPKSTTTSVTATDPSDGAKFHSTAKINWHLTPAMLFDIKLKLDPILPPDDEYDDGANDIWAVKEEIEADMKAALGTACVIVSTVYYGTEFVITVMMPDETDLIPIAGRFIGRGAKALKVYNKLTSVIEAYKARKLARWLAKRSAKGKVGPVAVKSSSEVMNKGKAGTRHPNHVYEEADEAVGTKYAATATAKQGMCFVAGTPILMGDNTLKAIEQIQVGDLVVSREDKTNVTTTKRVTDTIKRQASATFVLTFANNEKIETTEEHPFYVEGKGFVKAGELGIGTSIVTRAGPSLRVLDIEKKDVATFVYNFTVEDFHTYFVGNSKLWVHNGECASELIVQHTWLSKFGGGTGGQFVEHDTYPPIQWLLDRREGNQYHSDLNKRGFHLLQEDCAQFVEDVMSSSTIQREVSDGTVYYDDAYKVVVIRRHDAAGKPLDQPGTCYRGNEQEFWRVVNSPRQ